MQEYHILKLISDCRAETSFHTPGHKKDSEYCNVFPVAGMDTTELSYTDDLSSPCGAIYKAQQDIARIVGAERSYIVTDGSTAGVMAMLYAARKKGRKILVPRNCHKSVWNACTILGIEPVIVQGKTIDGVMLPPDPEQIERHICADESITGLVAVSPDYYGNVAPLKEYSQVLKGKGKYLFTDGAHGGHLAFGSDKSLYAGSYADIWIDGVHKSMPALTQGALVHTNNLSLQKGLEEGLNIFRTSSPSYPVMASVEYAVKYCYENPNKTEEVKNLRKKACKNICSYGYKVYPSADWTKLAVDFSPLGISPRLACDYLEQGGIYAEFTDGRYILFYLSVNTQEDDLKKLSNALADIKRWDKLRAVSPVDNFVINGSTVTTGYLKALEAPFEYVELKGAVNRVAAANAGISPPCIPVVAAGEVFTRAAVDILSEAPHTFGTEGGKVKVVKEKL